MADRPTGTETSSGLGHLAVSDTKIGAGSLFGLVINPAGSGVLYVDEGDNILKLLTRPRRRRAPPAIRPSSQGGWAPVREPAAMAAAIRSAYAGRATA
jgi:hypothetical protein